jgi:hypothetical protein
MPSLDVQADHKAQGIVAFVDLVPRSHARDLARLEPVTAIQHVIVEDHGIEQAVLRDVGGERLDLCLADHREEIGEGMILERAGPVGWHGRHPALAADEDAVSGLGLRGRPLALLPVGAGSNCGPAALQRAM